jgi:hypothetical protein
MTSRPGRTLGWCAAVAIALALLWFGLRARDARPSSPSQRESGAGPKPPASAPIAAAPAQPESATPNAPPPQSAAPAAQPGVRPTSSIRLAYENEPRDAGAAAAEARIREIYATQTDAEGLLREVHCTATVCKIDARWSRELNKPYNAALLVVIKEFSKEISLEPGGAPEGLIMPMTIYVRRPGHAAPAAVPPNPVPPAAPAAPAPQP